MYNAGSHVGGKSTWIVSQFLWPLFVFTKTGIKTYNLPIKTLYQCASWLKAMI